MSHIEVTKTEKESMMTSFLLLQYDKQMRDLIRIAFLFSIFGIFSNTSRLYVAWAAIALTAGLIICVSAIAFKRLKRQARALSAFSGRCYVEPREDGLEEKMIGPNDNLLSSTFMSWLNIRSLYVSKIGYLFIDACTSRMLFLPLGQSQPLDCFNLANIVNDKERRVVNLDEDLIRRKRKRFRRLIELIVFLIFWIGWLYVSNSVHHHV